MKFLSSPASAKAEFLGVDEMPFNLYSSSQPYTGWGNNTSVNNNGDEYSISCNLADFWNTFVPKVGVYSNGTSTDAEIILANATGRGVFCGVLTNFRGGWVHTKILTVIVDGKESVLSVESPSNKRLLVGQFPTNANNQANIPVMALNSLNIASLKGIPFYESLVVKLQTIGGTNQANSYGQYNAAFYSLDGRLV